MFNSTVVVAISNSGLRKRLVSCLRVLGAKVCIAKDGEGARVLEEAQVVNLVIIDAAMSAGCGGASARTLVVLSDLNELCPTSSRHISTVCRSGEHTSDARRISKLAGELLGVEDTAFDLSRVGCGQSLRRNRIRTSEQREMILRQVKELGRNVGARRRALSAIVSATDELLTNALYNAPVDADGRHQFSSRSGRQGVELDTHRAITVEFGSDGLNF